MSSEPSSSAPSGCSWSWGETYAFSLALDRMAAETTPRGVCVPDLFRCRAVCKAWKSLVDQNHGERWHMCVPESVPKSGKGPTPRKQLLKCLFMKEMDLCTQRRHLAEAYYLVYLQEQMRKRKEDEDKLKRNAVGASPSMATTGQAFHHSAPSTSLGSSLLSEGMVGVHHSTRQRDAERVQLAIDSFKGFENVERPSDAVLRRFCNDLHSHSLASNNAPEEVLECIDTVKWCLSKDPELLRKKIEAALWLYFCDQARPELGPSSSAPQASSTSRPSTSNQDHLSSLPRNEAQAPSALGGGGCPRKNVRNVVSDFLQRFYACSEDNMKHEVTKCISLDHAPGDTFACGFSNSNSNSNSNGRSQNLPKVFAVALQQVLREEWRKLVKTHVQAAFSNKSFDLDSMFLVMKSLTKFQTKVCKDIIDTHVKRVAKHYVNETLPRNSSNSLNFKCKEVLEAEPSSQSETTPSGVGNRSSRGVAGSADLGASTSKKKETRKRKGANEQGNSNRVKSNKHLKLDMSVLPDCDQIRAAVRKRWKEEIKRQDALRTRPDLCMMCAKNSKAKDCHFKMCGTCCENATKKLGKACLCERHAKKASETASSAHKTQIGVGGTFHHRSPRDLRSMFPPTIDRRHPPVGWNRRPRRNAIFMEHGVSIPFIRD